MKISDSTITKALFIIALVLLAVMTFNLIFVHNSPLSVLTIFAMLVIAILLYKFDVWEQKKPKR